MVSDASTEQCKLGIMNQEMVFSDIDENELISATEEQEEVNAGLLPSGLFSNTRHGDVKDTGTHDLGFVQNSRYYEQ